MSKSPWKWTESLTLEEALARVEELETELTRRRLELIDLAEDKKWVEYRINKLRREAQETKS